jgi:hypothetical protein
MEESRRHAMEPVGWFSVEVSQLEKPTIAAINGAAVGGGFALAMACDLRIIADDAQFGMASTHRYALPPEGGITYTLPRIVGLTKACELLLTQPETGIEKQHHAYVRLLSRQFLGLAERRLGSGVRDVEFPAWLQDDWQRGDEDVGVAPATQNLLSTEHAGNLGPVFGITSDI